MRKKGREDLNKYLLFVVLVVVMANAFEWSLDVVLQ